MEEQVHPFCSSPAGTYQENPPVSKSKVLDELKSWFRDILFAFVTAIFIVIFVVQPVKVEGTSMQPHLVDQERIFVNRFIYRFAEIDRGDVVVFWFPKDPNKSFIKRVLALPGDEVEIRNGAVYVNGAKQDEPYLTREFQDHDSYPKNRRSRRSLFRSGRPPKLQQRQPELGMGSERKHLRQGGVPLLAGFSCRPRRLSCLPSSFTILRRLAKRSNHHVVVRKGLSFGAKSPNEPKGSRRNNFTFWRESRWSIMNRFLFAKHAEDRAPCMIVVAPS